MSLKVFKEKFVKRGSFSGTTEKRREFFKVGWIKKKGVHRGMRRIYS